MNKSIKYTKRCLFSLTTFLAVFIFSGCSQKFTFETSLLDLDANLKVHYKMSTRALTTDSSGNGYTLTNHNAVTEAPGVFGTAADFGNPNPNRTLKIANNLGIDGGNITIALWAKCHIAPSGDNSDYFFAYQESLNSQVRYIIRYNLDGGVLKMQLGRVAMGVADGLLYIEKDLGLDWHHFAISYNGTTCYNYIDGVLVGQVNSSGNGVVGNSLVDAFSIGSAHATVDYMRGMVDDVWVFNRALSANEVTSLYNRFEMLNPVSNTRYNK